MDSVSVVWFRRDLRLWDNTALFNALKSNHPVLPIFIFDKNILDKLDDKADRRVGFIHAALEEMQQQLAAAGSSLQIFYGTPQQAFQQLMQSYHVKAVFTNHDYEPYAVQRDELVADMLQSSGAVLHTFKDQVIFEKLEVTKDDGKPYTVFTPYSKKWKARLTENDTDAHPAEKYFSNFYKMPAQQLIRLEQMDFIATDKLFPAKELNEELVRKYTDQRNFPAIQGTSRLGVHLRFGTVSIRQLAKKALGLNETFLNELIWRDFYHMILWNFPQVGMGKAFKPDYDRIEWLHDEVTFEKWCNGQTGYPVVDAGMRELNETGFMHNRVRMIVASFLTKHLLLDWRLGEAWFAKKLLDFDLAANNGGWQWAAGSGCDAAPYFRVFNPRLQTEKFDKNLVYIRKWVPELDSFDYPDPVVVHEVARKRALEVYARGLKPR
jgi:deoxyribodipyrimidine photo-lyase